MIECVGLPHAKLMSTYAVSLEGVLVGTGTSVIDTVGCPRLRVTFECKLLLWMWVGKTLIERPLVLG